MMRSWNRRTCVGGRRALRTRQVKSIRKNTPTRRTLVVPQAPGRWEMGRGDCWRRECI